MSFVRRRLGALLFYVALVPGCVKAQQAKVEKLNAYLDQANQSGMLNGNILVADHGKVILRRAIGYADASRTLPLKLSDRFDIGSLAKEFDASAC